MSEKSEEKERGRRTKSPTPTRAIEAFIGDKEQKGKWKKEREKREGGREREVRKGGREREVREGGRERGK